MDVRRKLMLSASTLSLGLMDNVEARSRTGEASVESTLSGAVEGEGEDEAERFCACCDGAWVLCVEE